MLTTPYTDKFFNDTIDNGGATVDLTKHSLPEPEGRYYVGSGHDTWVHRVRVEDFSPVYLAALVLVAKREGHEALGTWVHEGEVHIEPTDVLDDSALAEVYCLSRGEKAYYDSLDRRETFVHPYRRLR